MSAPAPFDLPPDLLEAAAALLEQPEDERGSALATLQAAHPAHAETLREFMRWLASSGRMLAAVQGASPPAEVPHFAGYRVLRMLGEGAFGIVYFCEQPAPIQRQVAIKLLRPGAGDRGTLARFDSERRFLARLGHPAIAQIFDTGLLPDGRPWFVMEYVPGVPIAEYCDRGQLPIEARLQLFVRLCQGVQHAHDQGIVHRDLKPANVIVVDVDAEARPKIIDFGVARALERSPADGPTRTETGRVVGTPGYMSPEQMAGDLAAIDARSDVFSLGVVLYELLTGELPWGKRPTSTDSEPPRPSSRITTDDSRGTAVAQQRSSQPKKLAARLRGDLDWIVLRALARDKERRYSSAFELAADVQRHLRRETVLAGPPALSYRLRKFARRHRAAVVTCLAIGMLAGVALWVVDDYRATASARIHDAEAAAASMLARANDPRLRNRTQHAALRKALSEEAEALYDRFLSKEADDEVARHGRVRALTTLSVVHCSLGGYAEAERLARKAVADGELLVAGASSDTSHAGSLALAARYLGRTLQLQGRRAEARTICQRAVDLYEQLRTDQPATVDVLVVALQGLALTFDQEREAPERAALLARAANLQEAIMRTHPEAIALREEYVNTAILRAMDAGSRSEFAAARALLSPAEAWLGDGQGLSRGTIIKVHDLLASIASCMVDPATAIAHAESNVRACRAWMQSEPDSPQPFALANDCLSLLCNLHANDGEPEARIRPLREWVAHCATRLERFPEEALAVHPLIDGTRRLGEELLTTGRREDLSGIDTALRRACAQLDRLPPNFDTATRRTVSLATRGALGLVADALGLADAEAIWEDVAAVLSQCDTATADTGLTTGRRVMYGIRIVARRLTAGRDGDAQELLDRMQALLDTCSPDEYRTNAPLVARVQVLAAVRHGDLTAAEELVDTMLDGASDAYGLLRAADAMHTVWRAARQRDAADAARWRDRTIETCERALGRMGSDQGQFEGDPWLALPAAKCRLMLALARHARGDETRPETLTAILTSLAAWCDRVHAPEWDEALYREGRALHDR